MTEARTAEEQTALVPPSRGRVVDRFQSAAVRERWPDIEAFSLAFAFVFALAGLIVVFLAGLLVGIAMRDLIKYFGDGFWSLIPFTMQMAIIIVGGYVVATSPPVHKLIRWLAGIPRTPRAAVAFVAFFSMASRNQLATSMV